MKQFNLTANAERDLAGLFDQTVDLFGQRQAVVLLERFQLAFENLGLFPLSGHLRDDLIVAERAIRFLTVSKRFLVIYRPDTQPVEILRIVDGTTDVGRLLLAE